MAMIRRERDRDKDRTENAGTRRRTRYLDPNAVVDVNDVEILRRFMTEYGKIIPARLTGVTAAQQRDIKRGVRRARNLGLLA
jgi:small subunit ribosomal protein S18